MAGDGESVGRYHVKESKSQDIRDAIMKVHCSCHVTFYRLFAGLLVSLSLTVCSLLAHCVSMTSSRECSVSEVKVNIVGTGHRRLLLDRRHSDNDVTGEEPESDAIPLESVGRNQDEPTQRLPQCLIIGVRKSGTRALLEFLSLHPDVRIQKQELHFFDQDQIYSLGLDWYRRQMPVTNSHQLTLEKTPGYFVGRDVPSRVRAMNSSVRLLVIVRDPVERAISDYTQLHAAREKRGKHAARFEDLAIDPISGRVDRSYRAIRRSMYCLDMARWLSQFDPSQFHFVNGERLVTRPVEELRRVETFLGLQHHIDDSMFYFNASRGFYCIRAPPIADSAAGAPGGSPEVGGASSGGTEVGSGAPAIFSDRCLASSKGRTHPNISSSVIRKLNAFFRPYNEMFYKQTRTDFGWSTT